MMDEVDHVMSLNVAVSKDFSLRADFTPKICTEINKNIFLRYSAGAAHPKPSDKHRLTQHRVRISISGADVADVHTEPRGAGSVGSVQSSSINMFSGLYSTKPAVLIL